MNESDQTISRRHAELIGEELGGIHEIPEGVVEPTFAGGRVTTRGRECSMRSPNRYRPFKATGMDAIVYRGDPPGIRFADQPRRMRSDPHAATPLTTDPMSAPPLSEAQAADLLCRDGLVLASIPQFFRAVTGVFREGGVRMPECQARPWRRS
ncbi:hypothetical protein AB0L63_29980 [Nocardia sp. NPDC051990]|uniref:hypothetical protein n=1 Tax=Nocardia sp. NPDC051990 TaxID=3155285 RepID=UPI003445976B